MAVTAPRPIGLAVIGNITLDHEVHADGRHLPVRVGGAALRVATAAAGAGQPAAPVSVIGDDLRDLPAALARTGLNTDAVKIATGRSARFTMTYSHDGELTGLTGDTGVATGLTAHALSWIACSRPDAYHVCCRRPLDVHQVLEALIRRGTAVSVDFYLPSAAENMAAAAEFLPRTRCVFVNQAEYEILTSAIAPRRLSGLLVTDGPRPALLLRHGRRSARVLPARVPVRCPTGAGDTVAGTFLAAQATGHTDQRALERAVATATTYVRGDARPLTVQRTVQPREPTPR
jgi:sugar/nucleoside kinase (ribokinase family)